MNEFVNTLVQQLQERMGEEVSVEQREVIRANDIDLQAICFRQGGLMTGSCYADEYYQMFQNGTSMDEIVDAILAEYQNGTNLVGEIAAKIMEDIYQYEKVSEHVVVKLLSLSKNRKYLKNKVYIKLLDFAVCFAVYMEELGDNALSAVVITEEIFQKWGISVGELYERAVENTRRFWEEKIESLTEVLNRLTEGDGFSEHMNKPEAQDAPDMYLLTNRSGVDGAVSILYRGVLKDFSASQGVDKLYLFPLSRNEFVIIPDDGDMDVDQLTKIIREMNETGVAEDYLGDRIYQYERATDEITFG